MKVTYLLIALSTMLVGCEKELHNYNDFEIKQARIEYSLYKNKEIEIVNSSKHCISEITVFTKDTPNVIDKCIEYAYISNGIAYKGKEGYSKTFLVSQLLTSDEKVENNE